MSYTKESVPSFNFDRLNSDKCQNKFDFSRVFRYYETCRFVIILWDFYMNVNRVTDPLSVVVNGQTPVQVTCCQSGTCIKVTFPEKNSYRSTNI